MKGHTAPAFNLFKSGLRAIAWLWFPLAMLLGAFLGECLVNGVDSIGTIKRTGTNATVNFSPAPPCFEMEWAPDMASPVWVSYLHCHYTQNPMLPFNSFAFPVNHQSQTQGFWRLRECAAP